jgi:anti-sigma regulatory factor (Ser/Thr protein kinase)
MAEPVTAVDRAFVSTEITTVRHEIGDRAAAAGLRGDRLDGFVLAVNEIITNVVLHAGGHGWIRLDIDATSVVCVVADAGGGIPEQYLEADAVPDAFELGGRGIWLTHQLCDAVTITTGPEGTTVAMRTHLPVHDSRYRTGDTRRAAADTPRSPNAGPVEPGRSTRESPGKRPALS